MLTGRHVFKAEAVMQMVLHHIQSPPEPLSRLSAFPVPEELEKVVLECLAKHPLNRPASAWELADRLARCGVESPWTPEDARQWWEARVKPEPALTLSN
jgi:serine/threonine-protein kinase